MAAFYSRREFVSCCLRPVISVSIGLMAGACSKDKATEESKKEIKSCDDYSAVSEAELEKRTKLAYVKKAPDPARQCNACKLYLPPKSGEKCGGCTLFKGPVDSEGSCAYWAPLDSVG